VLPITVGQKVGTGADFFLILFLFYHVSCNITQQLIKQIDTLNSTHKN